MSGSNPLMAWCGCGGQPDVEIELPADPVDDLWR